MFLFYFIIAFISLINNSELTTFSHDPGLYFNNEHFSVNLGLDWLITYGYLNNFTLTNGVQSIQPIDNIPSPPSSSKMVDTAPFWGNLYHLGDGFTYINNSIDNVINTVNYRLRLGLFFKDNLIVKLIFSYVTPKIEDQIVPLYGNLILDVPPIGDEFKAKVPYRISNLFLINGFSTQDFYGTTYQIDEITKFEFKELDYNFKIFMYSGYLHLSSPYEINTLVSLEPICGLVYSFVKIEYTSTVSTIIYFDQGSIQDDLKINFLLDIYSITESSCVGFSYGGNMRLNLSDLENSFIFIRGKYLCNSCIGLKKFKYFKDLSSIDSYIGVVWLEIGGYIGVQYFFSSKSILLGFGYEAHIFPGFNDFANYGDSVAIGDLVISNMIINVNLLV